MEKAVELALEPHWLLPVPAPNAPMTTWSCLALLHALEMSHPSSPTFQSSSCLCPHVSLLSAVPCGMRDLRSSTKD